VTKPKGFGCGPEFLRDDEPYHSLRCKLLPLTGIILIHYLPKVKEFIQKSPFVININAVRGKDGAFYKKSAIGRRFAHEG